MKKIVIKLVVVMYSGVLFSQTTFFKGIEGMVSDDIIFQECMLSQEEGESASFESITKVKFDLKKDKFQNYAGFRVVDLETKKTAINAGYYKCKERLDHYTHPGYIEKVNQDKYIIVDSVVYCLWYTNEDLTTYKIKSVFIPMLEKGSYPKTDKELEALSGFKKKLLKGASKMTEKMGGNPFVLEQSNVKHKDRIDQYLVEVKALQKNHPYSNETKQKLTSLKEDCDKESAEIQKFNEEYMQSEEYQEIMKRNAFFDGKKTQEAKKQVTIKNLTGEIVKFGNKVNIVGAGANPGATVSVSCEEDIYLYKAINNSFKNVKLINRAGTNCQQTIEIK